jgi:hypothetical protein
LEGIWAELKVVETSRSIFEEGNRAKKEIDLPGSWCAGEGEGLGRLLRKEGES